jgi:Xaa-Pro aminopeptidase
VKYHNKFISIIVCCWFILSTGYAQSGHSGENIPKDYLSASFHAGRREALRKLMSSNSVVAIFAYPTRTFSNDVDYVYHPNPDLYYFSGYKEPEALLLIFKEMQSDSAGSFNELFFVRRRDSLMEQFTGRRLGIEGVKKSLGFKRVYNSEDFGDFPIALKKMNVIYDILPDTTTDMRNLVYQFILKSSVRPIDKALNEEYMIIYNYISQKNMKRFLANRKIMYNTVPFKNDSLIRQLISRPDSLGLADFKKHININDSTGSTAYNRFTNQLRGIKTPEEIVLLRKSVWISGKAHAEAMRAVNPGMSERELEGIMLYVHKKYGAEDEGYPPIIGAGANGCILHYEENNAMNVENQLVLMDVGAMYHGYSADVTRTFPANGHFTNEQRIIYKLVYDAQDEAFKYCKAGTTFDSLESKTARVLATGLLKLGLIKEEKEVTKYYPHGMSHHIGLDVHDNGNYDTLRENMVITVEPGIYIPAGSPVDKKWWNIGVRIEDDVLIGKNNYELLSASAPRQWQEVEKMIAKKSIFDKGAGH